MATSLSESHAYLIESDAVRNQNWIGVSGDPDTIDLDNYTEGTDYCEIDFPIKFDKRGITGAKVPPSPGGGITADERDKARYYVVNFVGTISTRAKALLIDKFLMSNDHTSGEFAVFKRYHMIFYYGTNDHEQFTDANSARKSYCTGIVAPDFNIQWDVSKPLNKNINFIFKSVWAK